MRDGRTVMSGGLVYSPGVGKLDPGHAPHQPIHIPAAKADTAPAAANTTLQLTSTD